MLHMWFIIWSEKLTPCPCCLSIFLCAPLRAHGHECDALAVFMWEVVCRCVCPQLVCMCCRKCVFVICETERTKRERERECCRWTSVTADMWRMECWQLMTLMCSSLQESSTSKPQATFDLLCNRNNLSNVYTAKDSKRKERWLKVHCPANHWKISSLKPFYS